jgi:hypothetical protein
LAAVLRWSRRLFRHEFWSLSPLYAAFLIMLSLLLGVFAVRQYNELSTIAQKSPVAARLDKVWHVSVRGGGTFGIVSYERVTPAGRADCTITLRLGGLGQPLAAGQWIPIIPRPDSCYEPIVIGFERYPLVLASMSLVSLPGSAVLLFGFAQHRSQPPP